MSAVLLKDTPYCQVGQGLTCLSGGQEPVTSASWQTNVIDNPAQRQVVIDAINGKITPAVVSFENLVLAEQTLTAKLCEAAGLAYPGDEHIKQILFGDAGTVVSVHTRYRPGGFHRTDLLKAAEKLGIKLYGDSPDAADHKDGEVIVTKHGVSAIDVDRLFSPTNSDNHPFMLDFAGQDEWAREMGGDGISSAEEALWVIIRTWLEKGGVMPWMGGSLRCRNTYGTDRSLNVDWSADNGLSVNGYDRTDRYWNLGALPRK